MIKKCKDLVTKENNTIHLNRKKYCDCVKCDLRESCGLFQKFQFFESHVELLKAGV
jgi:hypothetical protein